MDIFCVGGSSCSVFFDINDPIDQVDGIPVQRADGCNQPRIISGKQPAESKGAQACDERNMKPGNASENLQRSDDSNIRKACWFLSRQDMPFPRMLKQYHVNGL